MDLKRAFRSASHRLSYIEDMRTGQVKLFENVEFDPDSEFLDFEFRGSPRPSTALVTKRIYARHSTQTYVMKLQLKDQERAAPSVVLKVYRIEEEEEEKEKDHPGLARHEVEIRYLRLLADLVIFHKCPHITLPIGRSVVDAETARKLLGGPSITIKPGKYHVILSESADQSLTDLITSKNKHKRLTFYQLQVILFQIIYTLATIQRRFPSFRHNDLHLSNVLVQNLDTGTLTRAVNHYCMYYHQKEEGGKEKTTKFYHDLVRCPFRILLWDMYFSSIADLQELTPLHSRRSSVPNKYYDLHKLFDSLEYVLGGSPIDERLRELLDDVVPPAYKCMPKNLTREQKKKLQLHTVHHVTPEELLHHKFFKSLRFPKHPFNCVRKYKT